MKRIITISLILLVLVGGCTAILLMNKKKIDEKSKMNGNLDSIPVDVMAVHKATLDGFFEVNGSLLPVHEVTVMSEVMGKVTDLPVNTGDAVAAGQVIARLDDEVARSQVALADAALAKAKSDLAKFEGLLRSDAIAGQQVEDLRLGLRKAETDLVMAKKQLSNMTITAPVAGTITRRPIEKGSLLMPGSPVVDIVDINRLKFIANVAEPEVVQIRKGQPVNITSTVFPGSTYKGTVVSVGVKADDARRFPVESEIVNDPSHPLKAGMFGTATFGSGTPREALTIPRNSVVGSIKSPKVFVIENGRSVLRDVRIGQANDREVEITDGLHEGDRVVTAGQINLDDQARVRVVNNK
ncbi:MAG TPA: efflux RND transporter periplasmic adaptor subunit [Bacteroidales bacterium]|nr:efflux RND transporter periplasmic adaptor subunit [Bacteroidales bacterium]HPS62762.1 efflux RND transporter periplasmic adaptor subunit [Bacteroidales bacterium]